MDLATSVKPKISTLRSALIGAIAGIVAFYLSSNLNPNPTDPNTILYWSGVAIAGALVGLAVAAVLNRRRG
jgi:prolipoprotein diacylglyceryltransferase